MFDSIEYCLNFNKEIRIILITIPPKQALERVEARALQTGRFVNKDYVIQSYKMIEESFYNILQHYKTKKIELCLYDSREENNMLNILCLYTLDARIEIYNPRVTNEFFSYSDTGVNDLVGFIDLIGKEYDIQYMDGGESS
jgi:zeta toxin